MSAQPAAGAPARRPGLGLALSGGGFRAAFFHLGILARLAEVGLLRRIEVISTVSGGSILGALYYLHVKDLLENVADEDVRDEHYLEIVGRMEERFFAGVARHVRALTYADLGKNFRMARENYSRSDRIGELYDEVFYRPAWDDPLFGDSPAKRRRGPIELRDLLVTPKGHNGEFRPLRDNASRRTPVPMLLVNATSLNTGHNWRFQAVEMGEDPRRRNEWVAIDKNVRHRSERYEKIVEHQRNFELGLAVAASACVPALFHPLAVSGLFRDESEVRVQLVDGGVHDNQGVCGLIDTECERMILSDASGQMSDYDDPTTRIPGVGGRSANIYGDRVREEQLIGALGRPAVALMHLRKGRPARILSPLGPPTNPEETSEPIAPTEDLGEIGYGIHQRVQDQLSRVRTDLDSFTEIEAYALALYGHAMATSELEVDGIRDLGRNDPLTYSWRLGQTPILRRRMETDDAELLHHLTVANKRFMKAAALSSRAKAIMAILTVVGLALAALLVYAIRGVFLTDVPLWGVLLVVAVALGLLQLYMKKSFRSKTGRRLADFLYTRLMPALLAPMFFVAARIMLLLNGSFLAAGRVSRLRGS